ncbi:MAG: sodium:solute symporter [Planctomycetota bacterium]|nr:MAG: sodium:solute symporter [Planctomycetota bacterium]
MTLRRPTFFASLTLLLCSFVPMAAACLGQELAWEQLPPIPDDEGFAGPLVGVHDDALIVAGGANFPALRPWQGGTKVWYDTVFVLRDPKAKWQNAGKLPRPLAYGVALTTSRGIFCAGGSDAHRHYADCFLLRLEGEAVRSAPLPKLPRPCANFCGALVGNTVYLAGGVEAADATEALKTFWALDLVRPESTWRKLEPWPGKERMLATAAAQDGSFFLFGGVALKPDAEGQPKREYLRDAYRYTPGNGWRRIADLPQFSAAAPTPAPSVGQSHVFLLGGDDGSQLTTPPDEHTGFPRDVLAYDTITDTWTRRGQLPFSLVTTTTARWRDRIIVPGGEARPGVRSTEVWSGSIAGSKASFGWLNYAALIGYLVGMVAIGGAFASRNKNTDDYFTAGGRIPWWAAGLSIYATMLSSLTFMSIPAKAYASDWTFFWANVPILLLAPLVIRCYLPFFRQLDVASAYEYLEKRFNLAARLYGSGAFILFQVGRQAIVLLLPAMALAAVSDLDVRLCIVLMGAMCMAYTSLGGIQAVIWADVVQSIVLLGAALVSLGLIVWRFDGGLSGIWSVAESAGKTQMFHFTLDPSTAANAFWVILVGNLFITLVPYTSDQAVIQRYLTTKDEAKAARAIWTNGLLAIPSTALFFAIGTALFVFYRSQPERLDPVRPTDAVFPAFIVGNLPAGIAGLAIAGIFAAAQSTISSSLNSVVTALMTDFYGRFGGDVAARRGLRIARWLTAAIGVLATAAALALAEFNLKSLWDAYNSLVGLAGSGLAGLFALGVFTRRATGTSALAGAAASALVLYFVQQRADVHFFLYAMVGIVTCFIVGWTGGLLLPGESSNRLAGLTIHDAASRSI